MIWLTWRQFRAPATVVLSAVALLAITLAVTGPHLAALHRDAPSDFLRQFSNETGTKVVYGIGLAVVYALPAVIGAFWGAPLVARELESGTHRLAWTQSVTRRRWLATKLGLVAGAATLAGLVSLVVTWWCTPLDTTVNHTAPDGGFLSMTRLSGPLLGARGVVPIGYAVLALVIGVAAGLVVRRTVPAMALTFAAVIAVQIVMPVVVAPRLLPAEHQLVTITPENLRGMMIAPNGTANDVLVQVDHPGAWVTGNQTVDRTGAAVDQIPVKDADCREPARGQATQGGPSQSCFDQLAASGYHQLVEYQPASRYWPLQWLQTGILLGAALALTGFCFWRIRRDLS